VVNKVQFYSIILAGGIGERLWPYSTPDRPKQIIPFLNGESLLTQTINRCKLFSDKIFIITSKEQQSLIAKAIDGLGCELLIEPTHRNTAPAIMYSLFEVQKINPNAIVGFFPADHYIPDYDVFSYHIKKIQEYVSINYQICLLGLTPKHPATGYGYIEVVDETVEVKGFYSIKKFHEKPCLSVAEQYLKNENKFWNLGIFIAEINSFIDECKICAPEIFDKVFQYFQNKDEQLYEQVLNQSIDYAVMEKSLNIVLHNVAFEWNDVGNLDVFMALKKEHGNFIDSNVIEINSKNNLIDVKGKLVALIGVADLCVVEQNEILLISKRSDVEMVKGLHLVYKSKKESSETSD